MEKRLERRLKVKRVTDQGTEEINCFKDELLVSYPRNPQLLQLLMGDVQKLLSAHLLSLETLHILLETVIQTLEKIGDSGHHASKFHHRWQTTMIFGVMGKK